MKKDISSTAKHTVIYGLGNLLVKIAGLILIPLYTSELDLSEYGMLILLEVTSQFLVGVLSFNIPGAMLRFGSEVDAIIDRKKIYFTSFITLLGIVLLSQIILQPTSRLFSEMLFDSSKYETYFTLLFFSIGLEIMGLLPLQLMRLLNKPVYYISFFIVKLVSTLSFTYYFVKVKTMGVEGAVWGMFLGNAILLLSTLPIQFRNFKLAIDKKAGVDMMKFGAPLIFNAISSLLLTLGDRVIIKYYGQLAEVGVYGFAYKIGSLVNLLVINSFSLGFLPIAYKKYKDPDFKDFFKKTFTYFILITVVFTVGICLFGKEVIKVVSSSAPEYWQAIYLVPLIAFAFVFKGIYFMFSYIFHISKKTKYAALVTLIGMLLNIGLNFALIPIYGVYGAVFATFISYVVMAIVTYYYGQRIIRIEYELRKVAIMLALSSCIVLLGIYFNDLEIIQRLIVKGILFAGIIVLLWMTILTPSEKEFVTNAFKSLKSAEGRKALLNEFKKG